ncbi:hypothetical protein D8W77_05850 [Enterobacter hormaechei]|nr:hypothetical protein [Enterobacter hormaechei]
MVCLMFVEQRGTVYLKVGGRCFTKVGFLILQHAPRLAAIHLLTGELIWLFRRVEILALFLY